MIKQEEVGILGFVVREGNNGTEWLAYAKTEPGNVGGTQIAPTVQATESNYQRVHQGAATQFLEFFDGDHAEGRREADVLASEHGMLFLRKRNRNSVVSVARARLPVRSDAWRWLAAEDMRWLMTRDFVVNTDARSVIVSSPWTLIAGGRPPFERSVRVGGFGARLVASYMSGADPAPVLADLAKLRAIAQPNTEEIPLGDLVEWRIDDDGIHPTGANKAAIVYVHVSAGDREVAAWCQPLLAIPGIGAYNLLCQVRDGVLQFLFHAVSQPGLVERVELDAHSQQDDASIDPTATLDTRLSVTQSDEGGRFLGCTTRYRIIELTKGDERPEVPGDYWLSLRQIETLTRHAGTFTNEARSALSLLLSAA
jgi:oxidase EvaA